MKHPFVVGELYQNRQGRYEVARLDEVGDEMIIRYIDSGEEVDTSISLQARIWQNIGWEQEEEERQSNKEEARYQHGYGMDFAGLKESDFKTSTEGTVWRSRRGLAGQVAQLLSPNTDYTFVSWAIYRWPVTFLTHREDYSMAAFEMGTRKAKFTIELDEENVYYGLYIERGTGILDNNWDWTRLMPKLLKKEDLQEVVRAAESKHGVRFIGRSSPGEETFHFADGLDKSAKLLWDGDYPTLLGVKERVRIAAEVPDDQWAELYWVATTPKEEAIESGVNISHQMAEVMGSLLPVYTAAIRE